jgi:xylulose-5-phosphate/fructose-6-phosphate phosphoketolase
LVILRTPKGWTGPKEVDGKKVEGFWRAHQVPIAAVRENSAHLRILEEWMRSYKPDELFDESGRLGAAPSTQHPATQITEKARTQQL